MKFKFILIAAFLSILIISICYDQTKAEWIISKEKGKRATVINVKKLACGKCDLNPKEVSFMKRTQSLEDEELFRKYSWTIISRVNTFEVILPPSLIHEAGEYPIKIYWAYNNELSKCIGLDFVGFLGKKVSATIYNLREPLPFFMRPRVHAIGVVLKSDGIVVGAYIEAGRHNSFACSLDRKSLQEITNKDWGEWIDSYINFNNETEIKISRMTPDEIIREYYEALNRHDRTTAMACLTRRMLCDYLFSNMDDSNLYNKDFPEDPIKSVELTNIEKLKYLTKANPPGVIEYKVTGEFHFTDRGKVIHSDGINYFYVQVKKETKRGGWKIMQIGSGP